MRSFVSHVEDLYFNWDDDGEMVAQLLISYLQKPGSIDYNKLLSERQGPVCPRAAEDGTGKKISSCRADCSQAEELGPRADRAAGYAADENGRQRVPIF